jgi:hypothetical protein
MATVGASGWQALESTDGGRWREWMASVGISEWRSWCEQMATLGVNGWQPLEPARGKRWNQQMATVGVNGRQPLEPTDGQRWNQRMATVGVNEFPWCDCPGQAPAGARASRGMLTLFTLLIVHDWRCSKIARNDPSYKRLKQGDRLR